MATSQRTGAGREVVIAGGSFAGLAAAYTARTALRPDDRVTLVTPNTHFVFAPSLVRAALGEPLLHSSFQLDAALAAKDIDYVRGFVRDVRAEDHVVTTDNGELPYDRLIIATGGRPDTSTIPGLAGEFRVASWVVGEDSAMESRNTVRHLFENPGPIAIGAAQGASYISGAYELALALDAELRRRGLRDRAPLTFVTAEPYLGHLGIGQSSAQAHLVRMFEERNIETRVGVSIERVERNTVTISSGETLDARTAIIMPPFTGAVDIWKSAGLTDSTGMIPVTFQYQHTTQQDIYAAGVASYFHQPTPPLGCAHPPGTGYLSVRMGKAAAENVAATLDCGAPAKHALPYVLDLRIIDGHDTGMLLSSRGRDHLHHSARRLPGRTARTLKIAVERYLIWRLRSGRMNLP
ncbi:MAG TPA: FAD-dependent oxidoreductase [Chloroflexota bacterium]